MNRLAQFLITGLSFCAVCMQATAQEQPAAPRPEQAAYMKPLGRLATILGSVYYLRKLCGTDDATVWRDQMNELLVAQRPSENERLQLIAHFNNGYRTFAASYRQCTPAAELVVQRYLREGASLSTEIATRYGN